MRLVSIENVKPQVSLAKPVYDPFGRILLTKGTVLSRYYIKKLRDLKYRSVYIDDCFSIAVTVDDVVSDEMRLEMMNIVQESLEHVKNGNGFAENKIKNTVSGVIEEILSNKEVLFHLTDIRCMNGHTFSHSANVCILSIMTGISMGYNSDKLNELGIGALLHDIGKAKIMDVVNSEKKLTNELFNLIQKHSEFGWEILSRSKDIGILAAYVAWQHHERYDGTGYPRGLSGKGITEYARIVAVADVYEALATDRPYRNRMLPHEVIDYIESRQGSDFDPDIVAAFIPNIAPYPVGSLVRLNTGSQGIVVNVHKLKPIKPTVKILFDDNGTPVSGARFLDLAKEKSLYIKEVIKE